MRPPRNTSERAPDRTFAAVCSLVDRCGGCTTQSQPYADQLRAKRDAVVRALEGVCPASLVPAVEGHAYPFGFRTRLVMPALPTYAAGEAPPRGDRAVRFGIYERGGQELVPAAGCPVQHPLALATLAGLDQALIGSPVRATRTIIRRKPSGERVGRGPRRDGAAEGWLHGVAIRVDPPTGAAELTLVGATPKLPGGAALAARLTRLPGVRSLHVSVNPARSSYLMGETFVHLGGSKRTVFHIGDLALHVSPGSFLQTSAEGAERLVAAVTELLPERARLFADLYGGVGVFARASASRWRRAVIAESNPHAVADLRAWLHASGEPNVRVYEGRVDERIDEVLALGPDVVLVDPPRAGLGPRVVEALGRALPPVLVYVACGLEALGREARALVDAGYRVDAVRAIDMFPHTEHLETVVRFVAPAAEPERE